MIQYADSGIIYMYYEQINLSWTRIIFFVIRDRAIRGVSFFNLMLQKKTYFQVLLGFSLVLILIHMASQVYPYLVAVLENGSDLWPQPDARDELIDVTFCQHEECRTRHLVPLKVVDDFLVYVFV